MKPQAIGGHARAAKLSPERRREIAGLAGRIRWAKYRADSACNSDKTGAKE